MPTKTSIDNMTNKKSNAKRKSNAAPNQAPAKEPRTAAATAPQRASSENPQTTAPTAATAEASVASLATSQTTNMTAGVSLRMLPSSVNVPVLGSSGDRENTNDEMTKATEATTEAFSGQDSAATLNSQMMFTIRNYVTTHFFPKVKFITKKEKLAYYSIRSNPMSYCAIITRGCNLPKDTNVVTWWETVARRAVKKKVNQLRSDKMTALKKEYFGKWWAWVRFQF
jgi:hypothetical protein